MYLRDLNSAMDSLSVRQRAGPGSPRGIRRLSERDLLRLLDRAPDVVFRYRLQPPGYDYVNRAITRITGFAPDELYADPDSALKLVHTDDRALVHDLLARGAGRVPIVVRWLRKDGSVVWIEQRNTPVFNRAHELVAIEGIAREIVDPTLGSRPHVRVLGDIRIDMDRGRVLIGGNEVNLTPSEFRLLVLLTDQPGRTISRATIMEALWNSSHVGSGRTSEVHVSKLRSKIERDAHRPHRIETVRGRGYRFILSG
jgi:PAS domain S-box-containing protein